MLKMGPRLCQNGTSLKRMESVEATRIGYLDTEQYWVVFLTVWRIHSKALEPVSISYRREASVLGVEPSSRRVRSWSVTRILLYAVRKLIIVRCLLCSLFNNVVSSSEVTQCSIWWNDDFESYTRNCGSSLSRLRVGRPGSIHGRIQIFSPATSCRPAVGPSQPLIPWVPGFPPRW